MTPNIVTLSRVEVFVVYSVLGLLTVAACCFWICYSNEKRRRLFEKEMSRRRVTQLERALDFFRHQDRLAAVVQRQREDVPAVTLPVTHCERTARRRRFLPLERNTDGTG